MYQVMKRIIDIVVSMIGVIFIVPIICYILILKIKYHEKGPIFYKQFRIGKNGKPFLMYKFRTMLTNADELLEKEIQTNQNIKTEYEKNRKLVNDFRVTNVGKKLREKNIDEWPQFINALKGEMSVVGPRPYMLKEKKDIKNYHEIIMCKPGITGPWQITRGKKDFNMRNELDLKYCNNMTLRYDVKILLYTVRNLICSTRGTS